MKQLLCFALILSVLLPLAGQLSAQVERRDKAVFIEPKNEFMDSINRSLTAFRKKDQPAKLRLTPDWTAFNPPKSTDEFTAQWHNKPVAQALSGMCWCFSTTSFLESEIYRLTKRQVKLSELYTVYWEYTEKARRFVQERGNSEFGEGSESNAVIRDWKKYGVVPADAYTGLVNGQPFHDHGKMFTEMNAYLQALKTSNMWDEEAAIRNIRSIMNHYIGEPPATITVNGKQMTPKDYLDKVLKVNLDDYVEFLSLMEKPYYEFVEYEVPDNWWHSREYYNVPLDVFMTGLKNSLRGGYTVCIGGDVSEPGLEGHAGIAVVPTFDIPPQYIDESARQFRFSNGTTGDDHGIHLVGYAAKDGKDWYLIKDSGAGSRNNSHPGYYFYHEDYVKLKMLGFMVHRDAVKDLMKIAGK